MEAGRVRSSAQMPERGLTPVVWRLNSSLYGPFRAVTSSNKFRHAAVAAPLPAQAHARTPFRQFAPESHPSRPPAWRFQSIREQKGGVLLPDDVICCFREQKQGNLLPDCFAGLSSVKSSEAKNQLWKTFPIFVTVRALYRCYISLALHIRWKCFRLILAGNLQNFNESGIGITLITLCGYLAHSEPLPYGCGVLFIWFRALQSLQQIGNLLHTFFMCLTDMSNGVNLTVCHKNKLLNWNYLILN